MDSGHWRFAYKCLNVDIVHDCYRVRVEKLWKSHKSLSFDVLCGNEADISFDLGILDVSPSFETSGCGEGEMVPILECFVVVVFFSCVDNCVNDWQEEAELSDTSFKSGHVCIWNAVRVYNLIAFFDSDAELARHIWDGLAT